MTLSKQFQKILAGSMNARRIALGAALALAACSPVNQSDKPGSASSLYSANPYNLRLSLTDAPNAEIKSVFVNVDHAELRVEGKGKAARILVAQNLGLVDLLTLQNGVTLPMADLDLPEGVTITQIRLLLRSDDNHIIKADGSRCDLKTPSAQQSGVKLLIKNGVTIEGGFNYSIVADFDAHKSIVLTGNGGCLLKPVLKLKSATKVVAPPPGSEPDGDSLPPTDAVNPTPDGDSVTPPSDSSGDTGGSTVGDGSSSGDSGSSNSGGDSSVPGDSTSGDTSGGSTSGDSTSGSGEGWDTTPDSTQPPAISPDQTGEFFG